MDRFEGGPSSLLMLAFDHRRSIRGLFGLESAPDAREGSRIRDAKATILDGLLIARSRMPAAGMPALLVDEEFGAEVLERGRRDGVVTAVACERSGQAEFRLEYGNDFQAHIERYDPDYVKALVRFNPDGDIDLNGRQLERLGELSGWLDSTGRKLLFELLVPPTDEQIVELGDDRDRYDLEVRPNLATRAVTSIQDAGIDPAVWKIEGLERRRDCERIAAACRRDGRDEAQCLILGRGADEERVEHWLRVAAPVPGFGGFAVGRTIWWDAIAALLSGGVDRGAAADRIADRYLHFASIYLDASGATPR